MEKLKILLLILGLIKDHIIKPLEDLINHLLMIYNYKRK